MKKIILTTILALFVGFSVSCAKKPIKANIITSFSAGDRACYVDSIDNDGKTHVEMANFEICEREELINRKVIFTYTEENVMAAECEGNPECIKSETVKIISSIKTVDE
jgi:hypothetical protein